MSKRISRGQFVALREWLTQRLNTAEQRARLREARLFAEVQGVMARSFGMTTAKCQYAVGHELRDAWMVGWRLQNEEMKRLQEVASATKRRGSGTSDLRR